jgi:hypothetical protein
MNAINNVEIITGTSGAQYAPMDFTPPQLPPPPAFVEVSSTTPLTPQAIVAQISTLLTQLVSVIISQQQVTQPTQTEDFKDTVETILENATWFDTAVQNKVEEQLTTDYIGDCIKDVYGDDLNDEVDSRIDRYMSHSFDITDYVNIAEQVRDELNDCLSDEVGEVLDDVLADKLDEVLESKVGECLDNILAEKLIEILSRRTITINF